MFNCPNKRAGVCLFSASPDTKKEGETMANEMDGRTAGRIGNLNPSISRSGFVKTMGVGMAAAATGLSMAAKAQTPGGGGTTTVNATGKYPIDVKKVQDAVDRYNTVFLSGTFNFGNDSTGRGCVTIAKEGVTLQADTNGATILGGGVWRDIPPNSMIYSIGPAISVEAPGVTIRGLTMSGSMDTGIFVTPSSRSAQPSDKVITIENNTLAANWCALVTSSTGGWPVVIRKNKLTGTVGLFADWVGCAYQNSQFVQRLSPFDIVENDITSTREYPREEEVDDGILVTGWYTPAEFLPPYVTPPAPDWGDNGPVTITGNTVTMAHSDAPFEDWSEGINIGRSTSGLNHCIVANNIVKGYGQSGISKWPYGHDNQIIGNDLSGFVPWEEQIMVSARNTTVMNNVFGLANEVPFFTCGISLFSANMHPPYTPIPLPVENCMLMGNDYRRTGLPGGDWYTCIWIGSNVDYGGEGNEVKNNLIKETGKFPSGTGPSQQTFTMNFSSPPLCHDNRIIGLSADNISDPGIGQRIKDARSRMVQYYAQWGERMLNRKRA